MEHILTMAYLKLKHSLFMPCPSKYLIFLIADFAISLANYTSRVQMQNVICDLYLILILILTSTAQHPWWGKIIVCAMLWVLFIGSAFKAAA